MRMLFCEHFDGGTVREELDNVMGEINRPVDYLGVDQARPTGRVIWLCNSSIAASRAW